MKYLLLILLLSGCASKQTTYDCVALNGHGVYARMTVYAANQDEADAEATKVVKKLVAVNAIPDNSGAFCEQRLYFRDYPKGK